MVVARDRLLITNPLARGFSEPEEKRILQQLPGFDLLRLEDGQDIADLLAAPEVSDDALVVVAGGDGTVAAAARALAGTRRRLGIVPLGTFNNFARGLRLPLEADAAAAVVAAGREAPVKLGRVNGRPFLEASPLGLFGDLINLGEAVKDLAYGDLFERVRTLSSSSFKYRVSGDVQLSGRARAMVVANTPSTGALVPVGDAEPDEPMFALTIFRGLFLRRRRRRVTSVRIETDPAVAVYADAYRVGETPADIEVDPHGLSVLLPA